MSDLGWNVWGAVSGVVGTLIAIAPVFAIWLRTRLPSTKLPGLLAILEETKELFAAALREGLIADEQEIQQIEWCITTASLDVNDCRATVYATSSYPQNVKNWWKGVSNRMADLYQDLNVVRVRLVRIHAIERKSLKGFNAGFPPCPSNLEHTMAPPPEYTSAPPSTHSTLAQSLVSEDPRSADSVLLEAPLASPPRYEAATPGEILPQAKNATSQPDASPAPAGGLRPTYHLISDADLKSLVSLAAAHTLLRKEERKRQRALRNEVLVQLGRQLHASNHSPALGCSAFSQRRPAKRPRLNVLARLLGPTSDVRHSRVGEDPESALSSVSLRPDAGHDEFHEA